MNDDPCVFEQQDGSRSSANWDTPVRGRVRALPPILLIRFASGFLLIGIAGIGLAMWASPMQDTA